MIKSTLEYLKTRLESYSDSLSQLEQFKVGIGNVAMIGESNSAGGTNLREGVIITVVNVEEEKTLKNHPVYVREGDDVKKYRPTIHLNVYVLFSSAESDYERGLVWIDKVLIFFQKYNVFVPPVGKVERVTMELVSLSFEQQNHMWAIMGSKYLPSVLYKLRLIVVQESDPDGGKVVKEIKTDGHLN